MTGRRPKPTHLKIVQGNPGKRAVNKREPKPAKQIPNCPPCLSDAGKVAWRRFGVLLDRMGVLTEADSPALERMCGCYAEILSHETVIAQEGSTYRSERPGGDSLIKAHPAVAMLADADRRFKAYLVEFGMTPSARSRVNGDTGSDEAESKAKTGTDRFF